MSCRRTRFVEKQFYSEADCGRRGCLRRNAALPQVLRYIPFNPVDKRSESTVVFPDGSTKFVTKGAPQVIRVGELFQKSPLRKFHCFFLEKSSVTTEEGP